MSREPIRWAVALDGGTTNTRARLIHDGQVVRTARRAVGVRDSVRTAGPATLAQAVREAIEEVLDTGEGITPDAIVAAGMLSADVGLASVPHVVAPAGIEELAQAAVVRELPDVSDLPILFVPGVRTMPTAGLDGWAVADMMRGEECETLGAWSLRAQGDGDTEPLGETIYVWPGSHTKVVAVDRSGRIVRSHTTLAGEITSAIARHTLIAASLPEDLPDDPDPEAVAAGARIVAREGLGRAAFLVRIAAVMSALDLHRRASFWIGAVIADDVGNLIRHPILAGRGHVLVGGRQPQRSLYAGLLGEGYGGIVEELHDDLIERASASGALAVAQRHRERFGR